MYNWIYLNFIFYMLSLLMLPVLGFDIRSDPDMRSCAFFVRFAVIVFVLMIYTHIHVGRCASVVLLGDD